MRNEQGSVHLILPLILAIAIIGLVATIFKSNFDIRERAASGEPTLPPITLSPTPKTKEKNTPNPRATKSSAPKPTTNPRYR